MKTSGTRTQQRQDHRSALRRIKDTLKTPLPVSEPLDYAQRAAVMNEADALNTEASELRFKVSDQEVWEVHRATAARFREARNAIWPQEMRAVWDAIKAKQTWDSEPVIRFLEADPRFFRSGYAREQLIRRLTRQVLIPDHEERLRKIVLKKVENPDIREFRHYGRLARRVDSPELRQAIRQRTEHDDWDVRRRARWMLEALGELPTANQILNGMKKQERQQRNAERKGIADAGKREHQ